VAVFDASAVLALLFEETGAAVADTLVPGAMISSVNLAEVATDLAKRGMSERVAQQCLDALKIATVPFDREQAMAAGALWPKTRGIGLSLGDRACFALARERGLPVVTGDRAWARLDLGVKVIAIR